MLAQTGTSNRHIVGRRRARSLSTALLGATLLAGLTLLAACGGDSGPSDTDVTGTWTYQASFSNSQFNCTVNAQASLQQSGTTFTGQVTSGTINCNGSSGPYTATFSGGTITGTTVAFADDDDCAHTGTLSGSDRMQGSVTCPPDAGDLTGTWTLSR